MKKLHARLQTALQESTNAQTLYTVLWDRMTADSSDEEFIALQIASDQWFDAQCEVNYLKRKIMKRKNRNPFL